MLYVFKAVLLAYICGKSTILTMNPYLGLPLILKKLPDIFCFYALFPPLKCQNCLYIFKNCLVAFFVIIIWCEKSSLDKHK